MIIVDDDDEDNEECCVRDFSSINSPAKTRPAACTMPQSAAQPSSMSMKDGGRTQLAFSTTLNIGQKWILVAMWQKNNSLAEIAKAVKVSESVVRRYIYDLIKTDAVGSRPVSKQGSRL